MSNLLIVTGATRGLGAALQSVFRAQGWQVADISRPQFDLSQLDMPLAQTFFANLATIPHGRVVLLHNASTMHIVPAGDVAFAADQVMQTNLISAIKLTGLFLNSFPNGEVGMVTSGAARTGIPHWSLYCAAKAGLEGFLRSLKAEGITTHVFEPGIIDTDMQKTIRGTDWPLSNEFNGYHKNGRLKSADEVATKAFAAIAALEPAILLPERNA